MGIFSWWSDAQRVVSFFWYGVFFTSFWFGVVRFPSAAVVPLGSDITGIAMLYVRCIIYLACVITYRELLPPLLLLCVLLYCWCCCSRCCYMPSCARWSTCLLVIWILTGSFRSVSISSWGFDPQRPLIFSVCCFLFTSFLFRAVVSQPIKTRTWYMYPVLLYCCATYTI